MSSTKDCKTEMNIMQPLNPKKLSTLKEVLETFACDPPKDSEKVSEEKVDEKKTEGQSVASESFSMLELDDRYVISPVQCRNEWYRVGLGKDLLDGGKSNTQDHWVDFLQKSHSELYLASGPMMYSILIALYNEREGPHKNIVSEIHKKLKTDFENNFMVTSTRINYTLDSLDEVIHGYRSPEEYSLKASIFGNENWITPVNGFEDNIEALLGTRNLAHLEKVLEWVSGKKPYLWCINNKQQLGAVRALVLGVYVSDRFYVSAGDDVDDDRPARGVAASQIFPIGNRGGK